MSDVLTCPKCGGDQKMSVVKAVMKGLKLVLANRCPKCKTTKRIVLDYNDKKNWMDEVGEAFFTCDLCGAVNKDNFAGHTYLAPNPAAYWYYYGEARKIAFICKNCGSRRIKVTTGDFWNNLEPYSRTDKDKPPAPEPEPIVKELNCPKCEKPIKNTDDKCSNCGLELICDKCGAPLVPGSNFCSNCGDKVETFNIPASKSDEKICPSCHESITDDQIFCIRCGQEIKCDKCGTEILEGALFCRECGDPVNQGDPNL
ncbi:MAG: double zinc ribbon domain-containing protein [Candidatus Helarchaeota archaeon]